MNSHAKLLLEEILADFDYRISKLIAMGDFMLAEELERFKREYFTSTSEALTNWTQRASRGSKFMPNLISAHAKPYSTAVSSSVASEAQPSVSKLVGIVRKPIDCLYHFGYLTNLPIDQSVPQDCVKCFKLTECLDSWKTLKTQSNRTSYGYHTL